MITVLISFLNILELWLKMQITHNGILLGGKKKKTTLPFATAWMDWENIMQSEISQSEKDKYHMISCICGI